MASTFSQEELLELRKENTRLKADNEALRAALARRHIEAETELKSAQQSRDENGKRIIELRDRVFELEAQLKETE
jgi:hypothetical protein